jgi:transposase
MTIEKYIVLQKLCVVASAHAIAKEFPKMGGKKISRFLNISQSTLTRWCGQYQAAGIDGLKRQNSRRA